MRCAATRATSRARQLTWLRRVPDAVWLDPSHAAAIAELVDAFLTADSARRAQPAPLS
jgi:hypothetical protein